MAAALVLGTACSARFGAPEPATSQGADVVDLWRVLFLVGLAVGAVVLGLLFWVVVRYRRPTADGLPRQVRANVVLEIIYTAIPLVIVAVLFVLTLRTQGRTTGLSAQPDLRIEATAFQWGWRFLYPVQQVAVLGDSNTPPTLVLPRGATVRIALESPDVIHAFFVPAFLVKEDVVPGRLNELEVTPTLVGRFGGYCAEFCGLDHTRMTFDVEVLEPPDFQRWVDRQPGPRPGPEDGDGGSDTGDPQGPAFREGGPAVGWVRVEEGA